MIRPKALVLLSVPVGMAMASTAADDDLLLPSPKMTLRLTPEGRPDASALRELQRTYHRRRKRRRRRAGEAPLVDYGGNHPYEVMERERQKQSERTGGRGARGLEDEDTSKKKKNIYKGWKPIRIWVNTDFLDITLEENPDDLLVAQKIAFLRDEVFPEAIRVWKDILRVYPAERLEIDKDGLCPGYGIAVQYDLVIFAFSDPDCDADNSGGRIANGRSCQSDEYGRPVAGFAGICLDAIDLGDPKGKKFVLETVLHEMGHIFGFYYEDYAFFRHPRTGLPRTPDRVEQTVTCVDGVRRTVVLPSEDTMRGFVESRSNSVQYEIATETVTAVARNHFGCDRLTGAWLENKQEGVDDCFGSHWDFRLFSTEFMTASATSTTQHLSPLTVALLEDSGWYRADYSSASISLSPFGRLAGCDFVFEECIVDGQVPSYSQGSFCTSSAPLGCDPTHRNVAHCSQYKYKTDLPPAFQYFSDPALGGKNEQLDYCPVYGTLKFSFSNGGSVGVDGSSSFEIDCTDPRLQMAPFAFDVETFGQESRCFDTDYDRPLCLKASCSKERKAVEIVFGGTIRACLYDGQKIDIPGLTGFSLICPRLAQICPDLLCEADCAGRGVCNVDQEDPACICNDPSDPSPYCAHSPVAASAPTVSPAPTLPEGTAYGRYASNSACRRHAYRVSFVVVPCLVSTYIFFGSLL